MLGSSTAQGHLEPLFAFEPLSGLGSDNLGPFGRLHILDTLWPPVNHVPFNGSSTGAPTTVLLLDMQMFGSPWAGRCGLQQCCVCSAMYNSALEHASLQVEAHRCPLSMLQFTRPLCAIAPTLATMARKSDKPWESPSQASMQQAAFSGVLRHVKEVCMSGPTCARMLCGEVNGLRTAMWPEFEDRHFECVGQPLAEGRPRLVTFGVFC